MVNYRYFVSGGPETYMFGAKEMLEHAGHEVIPFSIRYSRNRDTPWSQFFADPIGDEDQVLFRDHTLSAGALTRGLQRAFYAPDVHRSVSRLVAIAKPDVALVQHYLRKLSPSVLVALKQAGVPVVVRLSDFGMVCPEAHMLRAGRVCRSCTTHGLLSSVRYRCVQRSLAVSMVACASLWFAKWRKFFDLVDCFIAPSSILRDEMIAGGYDASRIVVLPTFVSAASFDASGVRGRRVVFVGRLSPEKGVHVLLNAYQRLESQQALRDVELLIAGEGSGRYASEMRDWGRRLSPRVRFLGALDAERVRRLLSGAMLSVVPSLWYENLPNSMLESLAAGTPVLASDLGSMADALRGTNAGVLFRPGDSGRLAADLAGTLLDADRLGSMGRSARALAETRYSPDGHLAGLMRVLQQAFGHGACGARIEG